MKEPLHYCGQCVHCFAEPETNGWDCDIDEEPEWNFDELCWECKHFKDAEAVWERAWDRHQDELFQRGKDEAKGIYD